MRISKRFDSVLTMPARTYKLETAKLMSLRPHLLQSLNICAQNNISNEQKDNANSNIEIIEEASDYTNDKKLHFFYLFFNFFMYFEIFLISKKNIYI